MRIAAYALVLAGALVTLGVMGIAMTLTLDGLGFLVAITLWAVSPFAGLWVMARRRAPPRGWLAIALVASLVVAGSTWIYVEGFFVKPDAQSGLLFLFIPFWQWIVVASAIVVGAIVGSRGGWGNRTPKTPN